MANVRIKDLTTTAATTASDDFFGVDGTTNGTRKLNAYSPTFGGNLTVSGTGTSSFAGPLKLTYGTNLTATDIGLFATSGGGLFINAPTTKNIRLGFANSERLTLDENTATFAGNLTVSGGTIGTAASTNLTLNGGSSGASLVLAQGSSDATALTANVSLYLQKAAGSAIVFRNNAAGSYTEAMRIAGTTGNLLLGAVIDGGNGKLQLATHTTSAGGIGFGSDTSLYRQQSSQLCLDATGGLSLLQFRTSGTYNGRIGHDGTNFEVRSVSGSVLLISNNTTALTLDSSQNATFAGSIAIGNTVAAAVGVASTHKVTISIGGSTYYLLATNV